MKTSAKIVYNPTVQKSLEEVEKHSFVRYFAPAWSRESLIERKLNSKMEGISVYRCMIVMKWIEEVNIGNATKSKKILF